MLKSAHAFPQAALTARIVCLAVLACGAACSTPHNPLHGVEPVLPATDLDSPAVDGSRSTTYPAEQVNRGKYMVKLLGCGICHTDGALVGEPDYALNLAGSRTGIAYSNPLLEAYPGVVYPPNITPDVETGIGRWSDADIVRSVRSGQGSHGRELLAVMPWPTYAFLSDSDALAISAYLLSLPPVRHEVPDNVQAGRKARYPYVHFGVYRRRE